MAVCWVCVEEEGAHYDGQAGPGKGHGEGVGRDDGGYQAYQVFKCASLFIFTMGSKQLRLAAQTFSVTGSLGARYNGTSPRTSI